MNEIVNKYLLAGDTFMPEMHFKQSRFTYSGPLVGHSQKTNKENKNLKKQEIQDIFTDMN